MAKIRSRFHYKQMALAAGGIPRRFDFDGEFVAFYSSTGLFEFRLNPADDWVPGYAGIILRQDREEKFTFIELRSAAGANVGFYFGVGDITLPANLGGEMQLYIGAVDDPNGIVTPADAANAAMYYKDQAAPVILWHWSVTNQNWFNSMA